MSFDSLPEGWEQWSQERHRFVLTYRPDVFDSKAFPAPCLPTIYVTKGRRSRRPGRNVPDPSDPWYVTLYLEPEVNADEQQFGSKQAAIEGASELATDFDNGNINYRDLYQVPRPEYFERLDELTGRSYTGRRND